MKTGAGLFAFMALYFGTTAAVYAWRSGERAGSTALTMAFLMSTLIAVFYFVQYHRRGLHAQDDRDAEVVDTAGPVDFFPPSSPWPVLCALGLAVVALGLVFALWICVVGGGFLAGAVFGYVFQYRERWS